MASECKRARTIEMLKCVQVAICSKQIDLLKLECTPNLLLIYRLVWNTFVTTLTSQF